MRSGLIWELSDYAPVSDLHPVPPWNLFRHQGSSSSPSRFSGQSASDRSGRVAAREAYATGEAAFSALAKVTRGWVNSQWKYQAISSQWQQLKGLITFSIAHRAIRSRRRKRLPSQSAKRPTTRHPVGRRSTCLASRDSHARARRSRRKWHWKSPQRRRRCQVRQPLLPSSARRSDPSHP